MLFLAVAVIHGEQKQQEESGLEDGRQSPPPSNDYKKYEIYPCNFLHNRKFILKVFILYSYQRLKFFQRGYILLKRMSYYGNG